MESESEGIGIRANNDNYTCGEGVLSVDGWEVQSIFFLPTPFLPEYRYSTDLSLSVSYSVNVKVIDIIQGFIYCGNEIRGNRNQTK
mmetsp:Transcript_6104/g.9204  ORF Transcript_6104/g.9204 Transcript_6104/m.9204 type:complete len:86 (-) Transcript_6104:124-381(-)